MPNTFRIGYNDAEILPGVFKSFEDAEEFAFTQPYHSHDCFKLDIEERDEEDNTLKVTTIFEEQE